MTVPRFKGDAELLSQRPLQLTASHAARGQRLSLAFFRQTKTTTSLHDVIKSQGIRFVHTGCGIVRRFCRIPHAPQQTNPVWNEPTGWPKKLAKLNLLNINRFPTFYHSESGENL